MKTSFFVQLFHLEQFIKICTMNFNNLSLTLTQTDVRAAGYSAIFPDPSVEHQIWD